MSKSSPLLDAIARRYEQLCAGKTGVFSRDVLMPIEELLSEAGCGEGEKRASAERQLMDLQSAGVLILEPAHKRAPSDVNRVRFSPANESSFYLQLGRPSPTKIRSALAEQFASAAFAEVNDQWRDAWKTWCARMRQAALAGQSVAPFDRRPSSANAELLDLLPKLLKWQGESLVRFASCVLCGESKKLESLAAMDREGDFSGKLRGKVGQILSDITCGVVQTLDDLGIIPNPRFVLVHGPLRLKIDGEWLDFGRLYGPFRISEKDLDQAEDVIATSNRCLTIENETSFHELAKLRSGELLVHTSYPSSGTLALLRRLPSKLEYWHFGDTDDAGFEILRVLREKSGRNFRALHMQRGRASFEQESLGLPNRLTWPFYD